MSHKNKYVLSFIAVILLLAAIALYYYNTERNHTITIGCFAGSYWDVPNGNSYKLLDNAIKKFEEQNENVKVEYVSGITKENYSNWLYTSLLSGKAPDVFFVMGEDFSILSELGAMKDLTGLIKNDSEFNSENYYDSAFSCGQYNNIQYALPYESAVNLMFVNKTILEDEGIEVPPADWTWEDFYNICSQLTKDKNSDGITDIFGVCGYTWKESMVSDDLNIFNDKGVVTGLSSDRAVECVSFIERLENLNNGYTVTSNDFDLGNVAFQPLSFSQYRAYKPYPLRVKKYSNFEWDCITMPAGPNGSNTSHIDSLLVAINSKTKNEKYAWEFMKLLTYDEEIQSQIFTYSEGTSPLKSVTNSPEIINYLEEDGNINLSLLDYAMENATVIPTFRNYNNIVEMVDTAIRNTLKGNSNISMALIKEQREINAYDN